MDPWVDNARDLVRPVNEVADSLNKELEELSDLHCIHFEELVRRMCRPGFQPKCVDCIVRTRKEVFLVEFKPIPTKGGHDISRNLDLKAVESLILYRRHLAEELGDSEPGLILVTQDGYLAIRDSIDPRSRHTLERYRKRDINGKVMFYDSVRELGSRQFVKFAKRHLDPKFAVS